VRAGPGRERTSRSSPYLKIIQRERAAEQVTLEGVTAETDEEFALFLCLNALGNDRKAHGAAQGDDSLRNGAAGDIDKDVADEDTVDLQLVEGRRFR